MHNSCNQVVPFRTPAAAGLAPPHLPERPFRVLNAGHTTEGGLILQAGGDGTAARLPPVLARRALKKEGRGGRAALCARASRTQERGAGGQGWPFGSPIAPSKKGGGGGGAASS